MKTAYLLVCVVERATRLTEEAIGEIDGPKPDPESFPNGRSPVFHLGGMNEFCTRSTQARGTIIGTREVVVTMTGDAQRRMC